MLPRWMSWASDKINTINVNFLTCDLKLATLNLQRVTVLLLDSGYTLEVSGLMFDVERLNV